MEVDGEERRRAAMESGAAVAMVLVAAVPGAVMVEVSINNNKINNN